MKFNENINRNEKVEKLNGQIYKLTCISATKSPNMLKIASNGCRAIVYHHVLQYMSFDFFLFYEY